MSGPSAATTFCATPTTTHGSLPEPRARVCSTHTHTMERVHSRQSLPSWSIARAGSGEVSEIFVFSRRARTPWRASLRPRFRANFGEGDTAPSIFSFLFIFFSQWIDSSRCHLLPSFFFFLENRSCFVRSEFLPRVDEAIVSSSGGWEEIKRIIETRSPEASWQEIRSSRGAKNTVSPLVEINYRHARW